MSNEQDITKLGQQVAEHGAELKSLTHIVREFVQSQEKINAALFKATAPNLANMIALGGVVLGVMSLLGFFIFRDIDQTRSMADSLFQKQQTLIAAVDTASRDRDAVNSEQDKKQSERIARNEDHVWELIKLDLEDLHRLRLTQTNN